MRTAERVAIIVQLLDSLQVLLYARAKNFTSDVIVIVGFDVAEIVLFVSH